jgi:hypothetical protein
MSECINIEGSAGQFTLLDVILRRLGVGDKSKRTVHMSNAEATESLKTVSYFSYHFLPNKRRRVFMRKGLSGDSAIFNLSIDSRRGL